MHNIEAPEYPPDLTDPEFLTHALEHYNQLLKEVPITEVVPSGTKHEIEDELACLDPYPAHECVVRGWGLSRLTGLSSGEYDLLEHKEAIKEGFTVERFGSP